MREESNKLDELEKKVLGRLRHVPTGHLRVMEKRGKAQFYYKNQESKNERERSKNGRYLRKSELAQKLSQRDYDMQL